MIRTISMAELTPVLEGMLQDGSAFFSGVSIDTRTLNRGDLYVAIQGERFDGHDFVDDAAAKGAVGLVVSRPVDTLLPVIQVEDTRRALGQIASLNRMAFSGPVVGITGSNGKTTVKEMIQRCLGSQDEVLATQGNLNNDIGVPLTLFRIGPAHRAAVIEMGANAVGEIAWTSSLASPDVCVITNAGDAHIGGFGSYENIVLGKGEIIDNTRAEGTVVLNADDAAFETWERRAGGRPVVSVSAQGRDNADLRATDIASRANGLHFNVVHRDGWEQPVTLPLFGEHNVTNALLAFAASLAVDRQPDEIARGLASMQAVSGRLERIELSSGSTLYDDSYNANPTSMAAALRTLAHEEGRRLAVLGDMAELGDHPETAHRDTAALARELGIDGFYCLGAFAQAYREGFGDEARIFETHEALADALAESLANEPATVLVKGSRSAAMDRVVAELKKKRKKH
ncbi:UDP-N-acetylmuramoyl-tripeptide--D-alanyl-D-alanine ligase [Marinobacteraceae bacterium S3BR75-40.1]